MPDATPAPIPSAVTAAAAAYHTPRAEALIFDVQTEIMSEELAGFLAGWLGLAPTDYQPVDLQTAAAVLVDRLGLREGYQHWYTRIYARLAGLG